MSIKIDKKFIKALLETHRRALALVASFFLIVGLLGALTYSFVELSKLKEENKKLQSSLQDVAEDTQELYRVLKDTSSTKQTPADVLGVSTAQVQLGPQGPKGEQGDPAELEGHWERYCLIEKEVFGYKVKGVLMRKSDGDCEGGWKIIKVWEK